MKRKAAAVLAAIMLMLSLVACGVTDIDTPDSSTSEKATQASTAAGSVSGYTESEIGSIPEYDGMPYAVINNNIPSFSAADCTTSSYEEYGPLDSLGRCTACIACVGEDIMPTEKRGSIGSVKPTGWHTVKYDNVDGKYLYNRCHLIGYQLTAENANERNLITGTRYLNVDGMLPFEDEVAEYVHETKNHVMYRVTPVFRDSELLARGVHMEAYSVEDNGEGVCFNVYCYNAQPGIEIDYSTGYSHACDEDNSFDDRGEKRDYIVNISTKKFHKPECKHAREMNKNNKKRYHGTRKALTENGYSPCGTCKP